MPLELACLQVCGVDKMRVPPSGNSQKKKSWAPTLAVTIAIATAIAIETQQSQESSELTHVRPWAIPRFKKYRKEKRGARDLETHTRHPSVESCSLERLAEKSISPESRKATLFTSCRYHRYYCSQHCQPAAKRSQDRAFAPRAFLRIFCVGEPAGTCPAKRGERWRRAIAWREMT